MYNALLKRRLNKKGFTLIELIVVIAIIAILAVILIPRFTGFTDSANAKAAMSDARNILLGIQALEADGSTAITQANIETFNGSDYEGTLSSYTVGSGTFSYVIHLGTKNYTVQVTGYEIGAVTSAAPAPSPT